MAWISIYDPGKCDFMVEESIGKSTLVESFRDLERGLDFGVFGHDIDQKARNSWRLWTRFYMCYILIGFRESLNFKQFYLAAPLHK